MLGQSHEYALSQIGAREFEYGLGGLIVGTSSTPNMSNGFDIVAYDLACPNCDRLNNFGWIITASDATKEQRGLYRYRIIYNGVSINVNNK